MGTRRETRRKYTAEMLCVDSSPVREAFVIKTVLYMLSTHNTTIQDSVVRYRSIVSSLNEVITSIKSLKDSVPDNSRDTYDSLISQLGDARMTCKDLMSDLLERDAFQLKRRERSRMQALARVREERAAETRKKIEAELKKGEEGAL